MLSDGEPRHPILEYLGRIRADASCAGVDDPELLRRFAANRDEAAFEVLVWRHGSMVLRICRGILRDAAAAEDAFQATFLTLACKATSVARYAAPAGWLHRVASNIALKARSGKVRRAAREAVRRQPTEIPAADSVAEESELAAIVHEEVNRLLARYRTPIVLCYLEGKTQEEVARMLGWPKGTVAGRLSRAREMLKRRLIRRGVGLPAAALAVLASTTAQAAVTGTLAATTARAALGFVAGNTSVAATSAAASHLAKGVIRTMFVAKMKVAALTTLSVGILAAGAVVLAGGGSTVALTDSVARAALATGQTDDPPAAPEGRQGAENLIQTARDRNDSINKLKQIGLAIHNFAQTYKHLPANITDNQGRKLLSWRVAILPYLEAKGLYEEFDLTQPWDSPNNKKLIAKMPAVFRLTSQKDRAGETFYQGFSGTGTIFDPAGPVRMRDITDGTSNTIIVAESATGVPWTKPEDITYDPAKPVAKLGGHFGNRFHAAMADGSVHTLPNSLKEEVLRALITRNGGEVINWDEIHSERSSSDSSKQNLDDIEQMKSLHAELQLALRNVEAELTKARNDLEQARNRSATRASARQPMVVELAAQNAALADSVAGKRAELQRILEELKRLRKQSDD